jgi:hypothetical protein
LEKLQGKFGDKATSKNLSEIDLLNCSWTEFLEQVRRDRHHGLERRLKVLAAAKALFARYASFKDMPREDRQGLAGFLESEELPWGWFGSMRGAGVFKNLVNERPLAFSKALDCIPPNGIVRREDYLAFIQRYLSAFPKKGGDPTRHGLGMATRLLAMKRPDYFVCFDSANKAGLSNAFGLVMSHHDYEAYWDAIIERILEAKRWNAPRPNGSDASGVWDGRAAFLDAIYYEP